MIFKKYIIGWPDLKWPLKETISHKNLCYIHPEEHNIRDIKLLENYKLK